ncbi:MAG: T9SS type A sorting domain-containing protein [Alloprevotella sp.]
MKKTLLLIFTLFATAPAALMATTTVEPADFQIVEQGALMSSNIIIRQDGNGLTITGAEGQQLKVFSMTGKTVATYDITSASWSVRLSLTHGWYILRIGDVVRKIAL